jgi:hypothetical protein
MSSNQIRSDQTEVAPEPNPDLLCAVYLAGQAIESAKTLGVSTACITPCPGDATKTCGGTLALNLYTLPKAPWLEADSTGPNLLTGSACVGAAASSEACRGGAPTGSDGASSWCGCCTAAVNSVSHYTAVHKPNHCQTTSIQIEEAVMYFRNMMQGV